MDPIIPEIKISCHNDEFLNVHKIHNCGFLTPKSDRFIPNRVENDFENSHHLMINKDRQTNSKILNFSPDLKRSRSDPCLLNKSPNKLTPRRKVSTQSFLILDAPQVKNDYYLNLLDWSNSNVLAVGLDREVYLWNQKSQQSLILGLKKYNENQMDSKYITSLKWINNEIIAIGADSIIEIWDIEKMKCIKTINDHCDLVSSMDTNYNVLTSGSYLGKKVFCHDFRQQTKIIEMSHLDSICGLKWNPSGRFLACGSYTGSVFVWDSVGGIENTKLFNEYHGHISSVKTVAWCPWQNNLLATGGGRMDGTVKFWNVYDSKLIKQVNVGAQISGILWSRRYKEILYGRNSDKSGSLVIKKYASLDEIAEMTGHEDRIISLAMSNNETVVSLSSDETLRFWNCFKMDSNEREACSPISTRSFSRFQNIR